jgi:hypothetical protein
MIEADFRFRHDHFLLSPANTGKSLEISGFSCRFFFSPRKSLISKNWWAVQDSNLRPPACKAGALTN